MTVGISAYLADKLLDHQLGTAAYTEPTAVYAQLHTGDPGASGTANVSAVTTRELVTFNAASAGAVTISNNPTWAMTATETISHVSLWDAATAGNFLRSAALSAGEPVANGQSFDLPTFDISTTPIAA